MIKSAIQSFVLQVFPASCKACGVDLVKDEKILCLACEIDLPKTGFEVHPTNNDLIRKFDGLVPIQSATSLYHFQSKGNVQHLIHGLKYGNQPQIGKHLGTYYAKKLLSSAFMKGIDAIIPIPLHYRKLLKRGYNQAEEVADGIALMTGVPVYNKVVKRAAHQRSQTSIGRGDRFDRMASSYKLGKQFLDAKHVLLVDDVVTTGATIEAVAKLLIEKYDVKVSVVSLAVRID